MGCDITAFAESREADGAWTARPVPDDFEWRNYSVYAFLAGVRNYSAITPISEPRGLPEDVSEDADAACGRLDGDTHSRSWLTLAELRAFDYDQGLVDRRENGSTLPAHLGRPMTYREYLGPQFFSALDQLEAMGATRVVFSFDG